MAIPIHELEAEALNLPPADRARLLERLIESFDRESKVMDAWLDEALRREQELSAGKAAAAPGRESVARIRSRLK